MPHAPLRRIVPGADAAVLLIHGILGTPDHFAPLLPCIPENWSLEALLLAGHGGSVRDFSAARMADWKQQVHQALARLRATHRRVYLAAHSMGTLFALQEAAQAPVAGLFLLNVPLRLQLKPRLLQTVTRIYRGKIAPDDARTQAALAGYSIGPDPNPLHYIGWVPRYLALFAEIRATRQMLPQVTSPGLAASLPARRNGLAGLHPVPGAMPAPGDQDPARFRPFLLYATGPENASASIFLPADRPGSITNPGAAHYFKCAAPGFLL